MKRNRALAVVPAALEAAARDGLGVVGLEVEIERDAAVGLARAVEEEWAVVLLSLSVEGVDLAVVGRLAQGDRPPALFVSAPGASLELSLEAERSGAEGVVREPFVGESLGERVGRALVAGKGFLFSDMGEVELRGFEDPVRLYEVRWREEG